MVGGAFANTIVDHLFSPDACLLSSQLAQTRDSLYV